MSRMSGAERIEVPPSNNVYTVLSAVAVVVQIVGLIAIIVRANQLFEGGLFK